MENLHCWLELDHALNAFETCHIGQLFQKRGFRHPNHQNWKVKLGHSIQKSEHFVGPKLFLSDVKTKSIQISGSAKLT